MKYFKMKESYSLQRWYEKKLSDLHSAGILTDEEFSSKKTDYYLKSKTNKRTAINEKRDF